MPEMFPVSWYIAEMVVPAADFICIQRLSVAERTRLFVEWCERADIVATASLVARATGGPTGTVCAPSRGVFPESWFWHLYVDKVIEFIRALLLSIDDRKQLLMTWCHGAGVAMTVEMVTRATGRPAGQV